MNRIGIIGYGAFGAFCAELVSRFLPTVEIRIHSSRHAPDGQRFFSFEDVCDSDAVILAVPIAAFEEVLVRALLHVRPETVIVDVATVKGHTTEVLARLASDRRYIATHPMFGPESYKKRDGDVTGFRIVIAEHTLPQSLYERVVKELSGAGFNVVEMSAETHDKHLAETLFLTHFIGQSISAAEFTRTEIDTVSFGYLMDAVESVKNDTALFRDVYRFVPYCSEVIARLERTEEQVRTILETP